jgi:hypothetical protein
MQNFPGGRQDWFNKESRGALGAHPKDVLVRKQGGEETDGVLKLAGL